MPQEDRPVEYPFPWPDQAKGYSLFPKDLEEDDFVVFHGTGKKNLEPIITEGFKAFPPLESVSFARKSVFCLTHICGRREPCEDHVVIAVRFDTFKRPEITENTQDLHVYRGFQPAKIIGYCIVPHDYEHR